MNIHRESQNLATENLRVDKFYEEIRHKNRMYDRNQNFLKAIFVCVYIYLYMINASVYKLTTLVYDICKNQFYN